jgi:hypothetical protein
MHALYITHTRHRRTPFHFVFACAFDDASLSPSLFGNTKVTVRPTAPTMTRPVMRTAAAERRATSTDARATDARVEDTFEESFVRAGRRVERRDATRETIRFVKKQSNEECAERRR